MLNWLRNLAARGWHDITSGLGDVAGLAVRGVAAVVSYVFGDVSGAWSDLAQAWHYAQQIGDAFLGHWISALIRVITYDIPHYAMTAWWWVTHPEQLADVLAWHVVRFLEDHALDAARYLGEFILHLVITQIRPLLRVAETVIAAIL